MATPETKVKSHIKRWLKDNKVYHFSPIGGPYAVHGVPDIICCVRGRFVGIEVKAPGKVNNLTKNQRHHIERIQSSGGMAFVADSLEEVVDFFDQHELL